MSGGAWLADGIKGRHVLLGFLAFFGVIFLANGIFLYYALTTFGGGETTDPYRKGLHYNETLAEAARSDERGWREQLIYAAGARRLSLSLSDHQGLPVSGLHIDAHIGRAVTDREDTSIKFKEIAAGAYEAELPLSPGQWVVQLQSAELARDGDPTYRLKQRLYVEGRP